MEIGHRISAAVQSLVPQEGAVPAVRIISRIAIATLGVAVAASCDGSKATSPMAGHNHAPNSTTSAVRYSSDLANTIRSETDRFHSQVQATKAGYAEASPCVFNPGVGGMGFHWVNGALVDPVFDAHNPEAVIYGPDANGRLQLVAVEYIVINVGQPAPTFDGQPFDVGGAPIPVPHWTLHVWVHLSNPAGLFNPWNPAVVCPGSAG
jgi:hypothetical protein